MVLRGSAYTRMYLYEIIASVKRFMKYETELNELIPLGNCREKVLVGISFSKNHAITQADRGFRVEIMHDP